MNDNVLIKELKDIKEISLYKINRTIIGQIPLDRLVSISRNFDDIDTVSIKIHKTYRDIHTKKLKEYYIYNEIKAERFISIDDEFFVIKEISTDETNETKTITAYGIEKKLERINFVMKDMSLSLFDADEENDVYSFNDLLYRDTGWELGFVSDSVRYMNNGEPKIRVQEDTNTPYYSFITDTIKEQFCCIPIFDRVNKLLNLYDLDSFGDELKLILSKDNFVTSLEKTDNSNDIITRLTLEGNTDKCDIKDVNPTGFDYIEDYSYFIETEEMSEELIQALRKFEAKTEKLLKTWNDLTIAKNTLEINLSNYNANEKITSSMLQQLQNILQSYKDTESDEIKYDTTDLENKILTQKENLAEINIMIEHTEKELREIEGTIKDINIQCRRETSTDKNGNRLFSEELIEELKEFTYYDTFSDDSFTDANELYKTGKYKLNNMCKPTIEYNINIIDFTKRIISSKFRKQQNILLGLGDVIALYNKDRDTEEYVYFVGWEKNYESKTLTMTLSNKKTNQDVTKSISDLLRDTKMNRKLITSSRYYWNNEKFNRIDESLNDNVDIYLDYEHPKLQKIYSIESLTLSETELKLGLGESTILYAKILPEEANQTVIWSSSDDSICTVKNGVVVSTGKKGSCTINCISEDGSNVAICAVMVSDYFDYEHKIPIEDIRIDNPSMTLGLNNAFYIIANTIPLNTTNKSMTYVSSDTSVAKVNDKGLVSGISVGKCDILIVSNDNPSVQATCSIEVVNQNNSTANKNMENSLFIGDERFTSMLANGYLDNMFVDAKVGAKAEYFYTSTSNRLNLYPSDVTSVVVLLGINDIYGASSNMKSLLVALRNKYPIRNIFVIEELPVSENYEGYTSMNAQIKLYNDNLYSYCKEINATLLDCSEALLYNGIMNPSYSNGTNLNSIGLKLLYNSMQSKILSKLNENSNGDNNSGGISSARQLIVARAEEIVKMCQDGKAWYSQYNRTTDWNNKQVIKSSTETIYSQGKQYTYNQPGKGKYGFDCSSFVGVCYQNAGFDFMKGLSCAGGTLQSTAKKHNAKAWRYVDTQFEDALPGDIVMMANDSVNVTTSNMFTCATHHTAIYMGDGYIAEAIGYNSGIQKRKKTPTSKWFFFRIEELINDDKNTSNNNNTNIGSGTQEYHNCFNEQGIINGHNYIYKFKDVRCTCYSSSLSTGGSGLPLTVGGSAGSFNMPYGTKLYFPDLDGKKVTDSVKGVNKVCDGIVTVTDTGVGCTDFDLYMGSTSSIALNNMNNPFRTDCYVIEWGTGKLPWSYTSSYRWATGYHGSLAMFRKAFSFYIENGGVLINFLKFNNEDKDIRNTSYWKDING